MISLLGCPVLNHCVAWLLKKETCGLHRNLLHYCEMFCNALLKINLQLSKSNQLALRHWVKLPCGLSDCLVDCLYFVYCVPDINVLVGRHLRQFSPSEQLLQTVILIWCMVYFHGKIAMRLMVDLNFCSSYR